MSKSSYSLITFWMVLFLLSLPSITRSEIIVHDSVALSGETMMLVAETRGKLFRKGGEVVGFLVDGKSAGKTLSGGDGFAYKEFTPKKTGLYQITATSGNEKGNGLLLSLRKGEGIIFIDVEGSLFEGLFQKIPKKGSQKAIKDISRRKPVVLLQTGIFGSEHIKAWLKEHGFAELSVVQWRQGMLFDELHKKGLKIKAVIGSAKVIESARQYKAKAFSFDELDGAKEVKDWEEIRRLLR